MGQILTQDNVPSIVRASSTTVTLAATNNGSATRITIGGQQYAVPSLLTMNSASVGANGLDAGSLGASQNWYVYAIVNQSTFAVALVASLAAASSGPTMPGGHGAEYRLVGQFYTDAGSKVFASGAQTLQANIPSLVFTSSTVVTIPATANGSATVLTVGNQPYTLSSSLAVNSANIGAGGLDVGTLTRNTLWRVYAIVHQTTNVPALIASQALLSVGPLMPSGYGTAYTRVAEFCVQTAGSIATTLELLGDNAYAQANYGLSGQVNPSAYTIAARIEQLPAGALWELTAMYRYQPANSASPFPTSSTSRVMAGISLINTSFDDSRYYSTWSLGGNNTGGSYNPAHSHTVVTPRRTIAGSGQAMYMMSYVDSSVGWGVHDGSSFIVARKIGDL